MIAIIPARGGSKRIPRKNLALCGGKPLVAHTYFAAKASRRLDRVLLSTDDAEIAALGRAHGIEVPYMRPAALSGDDVPMIAVLQDMLGWLERSGAGEVEAIVLLQPTSPLRTARHIDEAIEIFQAHPEADSVSSVVTPPHIFHPLKMLKPTARGLVPYLDGVPSAAGQRDLPLAYGRNGPAVLVTRARSIRAGEIYGTTCLAYVMEAAESVDIDEPLDLEIADLFLRRRG